MIRFTGVSHAFGTREVLKPFDLELAERRIAIIGANGSGKSTFARLVNGLVQPSRGTVTVDGFDTRADIAKVRGLVGFVFQNPDNQIVYPVVDEDIAFGLKNRRLAKAEIDVRVAAALARFGLSHLAKEQTHRLSGGEKQMVAIAGVTVMEPRLIVFDEPTTLLDLRNKRRVAQTIDDLPERAIVITHDLDLIEGFERVLVFDEGTIVFDGAPATAIARYRELMA